MNNFYQPSFEEVALLPAADPFVTASPLYSTKYDTPPQLPARDIMVERICNLYQNSVNDDSFDDVYYSNVYSEINTMCRLWAHEEVNRAVLPDSFNYRSVAATIATLSPREEWLKNQRRALQFIQTGELGAMKRALADLDRLKVGESADDVIADPSKNNPKVRAFYFNIADPHTNTDYITVDSHMFNIIHDDPGLMGHLRVQRFSGEDYQAISAAIVRSAELLEVPAPSVQSTVWYYWKRIHSIKDNSAASLQLPLDLGQQRGVRDLLVP